ncbi:kinectin isoform X2 [Schistocerca cancellata]|uniref:kinectin isoform X2 n=1 Tax=Schistocerca cancellata TaxID=274614 RepID=UPI0021174E85|nr:kinectin isoform X2 [Schistocerca cancellata]
MDLYSAAICFGVAIVSAIVVYVVTVFTMKEKTYEEAIAEQRNMPEEKLLLGGSTKDKNKEKKLKKAVKKVKEKTAEREKTAHSEAQIKCSSPSQKVHVEFGKPEAEVLNEEVTQDDSKKKKKVKVKPILLNKTEPTVVADATVEPVTQNHFEEILPKDDLLLKLKGSREDLRESAEKKNLPHGRESASGETSKVTAVSVKAVTTGNGGKLRSQGAEKKKHDNSVTDSKDGSEQNKSNKASPSKLEKASEKAPIKMEEKKQVTKSEKQVVKNEKAINRNDDKPKQNKIEESGDKGSKAVVNDSKVSSVNEKQQSNKLEIKTLPTVKTEDKQSHANKLEKETDIKEASLRNEKVGTQVTQPEIPAPPVGTPAARKKKKSELATLQQMNGENETVNVSLLMSLLRKAELSRTEVQGMIELLLNKQGSGAASSEWIEGRQDPVVKLKKQLAEKEKALAEEQEASLAFQNKLKEVRSEYNAERSRLNHSCRQLEEALVAKQNESQALAARLQHTHDTAVAEKQQMSQQLQQLQSKLNEERLTVRKLQEEQAKSQSVQDQLLNQHQQYEMHISRLTEQQQESETAYKSQIAQLHAQLQEAANVNAEFQAQHEEKIAENKMLMDRIACSEGQVLHLEQQLAHFKEAADHSQEISCQLEETRVINAELERRLQHAQQREVELQYENNKAKESYESLNTKYASLMEISNEVNKLRSENEKLAEQLVSLNDARLEAQRLQEENGVLQTQLSNFVALQKEVEQLREENESLAAHVTAMTERPAAEGRENGDNGYIEEKQSVSKAEELNKEPESYQNIELIKLSSELKEKTSLLEKLNLEIINFKTDVSRLKDELEHQRSKNDELRKKNWKAMEALSAMEKSLQSKVKDSQNLDNEMASEIRLQQQTTTRLLLQRIFPSIKIDGDEVHEKWVEKFEKEAHNLISKLQSQKQDLGPDFGSRNHSSMFIELEKQNSQLTALVSHYKNIIDDTEGMLNKLQKHVEQEEARWRQQIQQKETELDQLREERDRLLAFKENASGPEEAAREVCGVEFAFSCIEKSLPVIISEMQTKLKDFQEKLEKEQEEKLKLSSALDAAYSDYNSLHTALQETEHLKAAVEKLEQEKSWLETELEAERQRREELSRELLDARSLSKTAKDFSFHEHEIVADLQQKTEKLNGISEKYSSSSNGPASDTVSTETLTTNSQPLPEHKERKLKSKRKKGGSGRK